MLPLCRYNQLEEEGDEDDEQLVDEVRRCCGNSIVLRVVDHGTFAAVCLSRPRVGRLEGRQQEGLRKQDGQAILAAAAALVLCM